MKKFHAILLAAMLLLSVGAVAVADEEVPATNLFTKKLDILNTGTTIGDVIFSFKTTFNNYKADNISTTEAVKEDVNAPIVTLGSVTLNSTTTSGNVTISHGTFPKVGIYTYDVTENETNVAGIVNYDKTMQLKVTVTNDDKGGFNTSYKLHTNNTKVTEITNTYKAGSLSVNKEVTGALGDKNKYFDFTVVLTGESGKNYAETFNASTTTADEGQNNPTIVKLGSNNFTLKHGQTFQIENLPYGVSYTVTESSYADYNTTKSGDTGSIDASAKVAKFTNTKGDTSPDTGITTDSLPYVMLLGFVLLAGAALIIKRRVAHN